ncbi:MAG: T9SS type A sorting domain-containing protein [Saprospiraceae bacterium]|nr:T9SS type A sorting domain-containing protein [Saprospiraceae bacterium]
MKSVHTCLLSLYFIIPVLSQQKAWQFDFASDDVYVRTDTSHIMHKATIDIPASGHVIARIEGECNSSVGDLITFGINDWKHWLTNFGNVGVIVFNEENIVNNFMHSRVFKVEKGEKDFYAVVQNWVDRNGSGYMSASGRMILEFVPDEVNKQRTYFRNVTQSQYIANSDELILDTLVVEMAESGNVLISLNGSFYASPEDEITLKIIPFNSNHNLSNDQSFYFVDRRKGGIFSINNTLWLPAGKHSFYIYGQKSAGENENLNFGLYGVFSAVIQYDSDFQTKTHFTDFNSEINQPDKFFNLGNANFEVPSKGTLLILYNGETDIRSGQSLSLNATVTINGIEDELSTIARTTHADDQKSYFYRSQMMKVEKGPVQIDMVAFMESKTGMSSGADVKGNLIIKFIADPITSSVSHTVSELKTWSVYPNPTSGIINISGGNLAETNAKITLTDINGNYIHSSIPNDQNINISDLPSGIYFMHINSETRSEVQKIIKLD